MPFVRLTPYAEIAQSVEQRPEKPRVGSSILPLGTTSLIRIQFQTEPLSRWPLIFRMKIR